MNEIALCINCGNYFEKEPTGNGNYCSTECMERYERCVNCGKYFRSGSGHSITLCSAECSIVYCIIKRYDQEKYIQYEEESA